MDEIPLNIMLIKHIIKAAVSWGLASEKTTAEPIDG